jgi:hypothetical protein
MLDKKIKKVILETKDKKEKSLIEENLVKKRIFTIVESQEIIENFQFLPEGKKLKIALGLMEEIRFLDENQILNEQLMDYLGKIFGNVGLSAVSQTIAEPLVGTLVGKLGLSGFFKDFITSFIVSDPRRLAKALKSCDELTKLIAESLAEAFVQMMQRKAGTEGYGYSLIRNALGGAIKQTSFVSGLEDQLSDIVCGIFDKYTNKASGVYNKLKPKVTA